MCDHEAIAAIQITATNHVDLKTEGPGQNITMERKGHKTTFLPTQSELE
jgi:hypothetical protein